MSRQTLSSSCDALAEAFPLQRLLALAQPARTRLLTSAIGLLLFACIGAVDNARAETRVEVLETWPAGNNVELGRNQNFYLRLAYDTDQPVKIWSRPFYNNQPVNAGSNPSMTYTGRGEALGWFFFMEPGTAVDEIRISAGDGSLANTQVIASWRGHITGSTEVGPTVAEPQWVADMKAQAKAAQEAHYQARINQPISTQDTALMGGFMLTTLALGIMGFVAPVWGIRRWQGGWRLAAAAPCALMAFVVLRIVINTATNPTSHNLWPFEIVQAGALSVAAMVVLWIMRKLFGAQT
ncbi:MAG TPA: hypothetical protein VIC08_01100 [Cellvibrionaceae bacterium]